MTLSEAQTQLSAWEAALLAAASGKSYTIGDRQLTRQDVEEIRGTVTWLERKIKTLTAEAAGSNKPAALACWNNCSS
jgi:hypothetical protein